MNREPSDEVAIVFADICGSTRLYEALGDAPARGLVSDCLGRLAEVIHEFDGTTIKTIGDEIMCTFDTAEGAVRSAMRFQELVSERLPPAGTDEDVQLAIKVGLQYGQAIRENGDVFGDAVNMAARMVELAKGGQIITTESTARQLPDTLQECTRHLDTLPIKGKRDVIEIFEVMWQEEDVTRMLSGLFNIQAVKTQLIILYHNRHYTVRQDGPPFVIGRGKKVDLVVDETMVSREHVEIGYHRDKFTITDCSTNGTYVVVGGKHHYLRRESLALHGEGEIVLGRNPIQGDAPIIRFECRTVVDENAT